MGKSCGVENINKVCSVPDPVIEFVPARLANLKVIIFGFPRTKSTKVVLPGIKKSQNCLCELRIRTNSQIRY